MERNLNIYIYIYVYIYIYIFIINFGCIRSSLGGLKFDGWKWKRLTGQAEKTTREKAREVFKKLRTLCRLLGLINICWSEWNFNVLFIKQVLIKWSWNGFVADNPCWEFVCWNKIVGSLTSLSVHQLLPCVWKVSLLPAHCFLSFKVEFH